jgi:hypothetical protein
MMLAVRFLILSVHLPELILLPHFFLEVIEIICMLVAMPTDQEVPHHTEEAQHQLTSIGNNIMHRHGNAVPVMTINQFMTNLQARRLV